MHKCFRNEIMIASKEGDSIQRTAREVVCDLSPEFPAQHRVDVGMRGVWEIRQRGHSEAPMVLRRM